MWDLLIRNVTRDASPLSSAELELPTDAAGLGPERWKRLLAVARDESSKRRREGLRLFPHARRQPWSPTTIPPPRSNNIRPAFAPDFGGAAAAMPAGPP